MMQLDLRKQWRHLYVPSAKKVELVDVPELKFVMIDGRIEPGEAPGTSPGFEEVMAALYSAAYTLKFMSKLRKEDPIDYPVMALEGLWWVEDGKFDITIKDNWVYTLMIMQPDHITPTCSPRRWRRRRRRSQTLRLPGCGWRHFARASASRPCISAPTPPSRRRSRRCGSGPRRTAIASPTSIMKSTWATRGVPSRRS